LSEIVRIFNSKRLKSLK